MADRIVVYPDGGSSVVLTGNEHLATGGEGSVYAKDGVVFKVYLEPEKARRAGLEKKLAALAGLRHPGIATPRAALRDRDGRFIGVALPLVKGEALCRAFTNGWRDLHRFGADETAAVVDAMREITAHAHGHQALMVDGNEMNWLLAATAPVAIDVDSWQLPGFPATAIMPSIRDHSQSTFSEGTDWFAWAVVTFQLWTGIHPYKGTHPDFGRGALEARMKARASVFDRKVSLPGAARPFTDIPGPLGGWYERTFQSTERTAPPSARAGAVASQAVPRLKVRAILGGALRLERLGNAGGRVLAGMNGFVVADTPAGLRLFDAAARVAVPQVDPAALALVLRQQGALLRTPFGRVLVTLDPAGGDARATVLESGAQARLACRGESLWQSGNRLFAVVPGVPNGLLELEAAQLGARVMLAVRHQWPVAVLSTRLFRGVFVQDCLGAPFLGVLDGEGLVQAAAPGLRGYKLSDGFGVDRHRIWLAGIRIADGETVRLQLALRGDRYQLADEEIVAGFALDAASNAAGVCVLRDGEDLLVARGTAQKRLEQAGLAHSVRLFSLGAAGIGGFDGSEAVRISLT